MYIKYDNLKAPLSIVEVNKYLMTVDGTRWRATVLGPEASLKKQIVATYSAKEGPIMYIPPELLLRPLLKDPNALDLTIEIMTAGRFFHGTHFIFFPDSDHGCIRNFL